MPRYDVLPGIGRVRVYDHGAHYADRYTILMEDWDVYDGTTTTPHKPRPYGLREGFAVGDNIGPDGFSQSIQSPPPNTWGPGERARRIPFASLLHAPAPRIAVENPIMHGYGKDRILAPVEEAGIEPLISTVQPWQFGTPETKATQLWLVNLPPLVPTNIVEGRTPRVHFASPGPNRWAERSRTDPNIAAAMADQWGNL